jgi:hypothetical protein
MPRILYDTTSDLLIPYPRDDDGPVVGLDPRYLELTVIQENQPSYDATMQRLEPDELIDLDALTVTRGWQLVELPAPPPPSPDYMGFYNSLLTSTAYQSVLQQAMTSTSPALATTIAVFASAIGEAMAGRVNQPALQSAVWLLLGTATVSDADEVELQGMLEQSYLAGTYSLAPAPAVELIRAKAADGSFIADDPTTPDINEAWVTPPTAQFPDI